MYRSLTRFTRYLLIISDRKPLPFGYLLAADRLDHPTSAHRNGCMIRYEQRGDLHQLRHRRTYVHITSLYTNTRSLRAFC